MRNLTLSNRLMTTIGINHYYHCSVEAITIIFCTDSKDTNDLYLLDKNKLHNTYVSITFLEFLAFV